MSLARRLFLFCVVATQLTICTCAFHGTLIQRSHSKRATNVIRLTRLHAREKTVVCEASKTLRMFDIVTLALDFANFQSFDSGDSQAPRSVSAADQPQIDTSPPEAARTFPLLI